jgi:starch-binding outer membrane protein, SusD/RagB family
MKNINKIIIMLVLVMGMTACNDQLNISNPNSQTTYDFGNTESDLNEAVIACYNRIRLEGTFARVGYTLDAVRGDEVWNSSQQWYLEYDNLNSPGTIGIGDEWPWRDNYHVVNRTNYVLSKVDAVKMSTDSYNQIKGQALFLRSLAYYELTTYYQTAPLITDYASYSDINTMYAANNTQDELFDQIEKDLTTAMQILPSRGKGGEWAQGRATCGSAAGYLARALMFRHKYTEAYAVLKDIIAGKYGSYGLMADYGDNFKEGAASENNKESLFEVQFMD